MKALSLLMLRCSLGLLMIVWGLDKTLNPEHSKALIKTHYFGTIVDNGMLAAAGILQIFFGVLLILGYFRVITYPILTVITVTTLIAVSPSIVDPWGWYLKGTNVLFFPSLIIFFASAVLLAHQEYDDFSLDRTRLKIL